MVKIDYWYNNANSKIISGMRLIAEGCKENESWSDCKACPFEEYCGYIQDGNENRFLAPLTWDIPEWTTKCYDKATATFYPNEGIWRGNLYKGGKIVGDFVCDDSVELERKFPGIFG